MLEPRPRLIELDLLRAAAILLVLGRHMPVPGGAEGILPLALWARGGWVGVDLFFVLSGFLVSGLLFSEYRRRGAIDVRRFLIRRSFKIYPAFYAFVAVAIGLTWLHEPQPPALSRMLVPALFLQNYIHVPLLFEAINGHCWSLCIEEHFYLGLPALMVLLVWRGWMRSIPALVAVVMVACLLMRLEASARLEWYMLLIPTHLRIDSLFVGVFLAYVRYRDTTLFDLFCRRWRYGLLAAGTIGLLPVFGWPLEQSPWVGTIGYTLFAAASGALLCGMLGLQVPHSAFLSASADVGRYSYSIYLWHWPVRLALDGHASVNASPWLVLAAYFLGSLSTGVLLARLIEFPALALRDRLFPSRPAADLAPSTLELASVDELIETPSAVPSAIAPEPPIAS